MPSSKLIHADLPSREPSVFFPKMTPKPFMKWAGGKRQLIPALTARMPRFNGRYFEPFLGGGALFFFLKPARAVLSDSNGELIHCYRIVRDKPDGLIRRLKSLRYSREDYYRIRDEDPKDLSPIHRAARTIYLNRTGFNGLYRVNSKGKFNVPMGRYQNPTICDEKNIHACSAVLRGVDIEESSFEAVLEQARAGDFVYLDPPYIPLTRTANFTAYQRGGFSMERQTALAEAFATLTKRGVYAMLSNSDVEWMHDAYRSYRIEKVQAKRNVNSNVEDRGRISELLVTNY